MPELPEVETVVRDLESHGLVGRTVTDVRVFWPPMVGPGPVSGFAAALCGRAFTSLSRRGKYIVAGLTGDRVLLIHLRMTGQLRFAAPAVPRDKHEHVVLRLDDGRELRYRDPRKFGRWRLLPDAAPALAHLGPEPLQLSRPRFEARLAARKGMLKPLLLDQRFLAGLGNIYVDEALWDARLHPRRSSTTLTAAERVRLHGSIGRVLRRGIAAQGTTLGRASTNFYSVSGRRGRNQEGLAVFRRTGEPCPRCGTPIARLVVGQRSTHICPRCQPAA